MQLKVSTLLLTSILAGALSATSTQAQAPLVNDGKSAYTIVIPRDSLPQNRNAAEEFRKCVEIATGVRLALQSDENEINTPFVSIGRTRYATSSHIADAKLAYDGFRIVTQNGNLYIAGNDTPEGGSTDSLGKSRGTANGVYTFLEDYLNVRWLMPGDLGRDVPRRKTFTLEKIDRTEVPLFNMRRLPHISTHANAGQYEHIQQWESRQKLGGSAWFGFNHNWVETVSPELFKSKPEWFAMKDGKRVAPSNEFDKLETTNPELIEYFAQKAIASFKASSRPTPFSLSPSDGRGWSESPESKALYDPSPNTVFDPEAPPGLPSMSSLVLKWYHDVSRRVAQEYPQGRLSGYIYSDYLYPPVKLKMELPDNFVPVIAPSFDYGYGLYRPETQKQFEYVMEAWQKVVPREWYFYDLPNTLLRQHNDEIGAGNFPGSTGIVTPVAPDILNVLFPTFIKNNIRGVYLYGNNSWSNAALSNYVVAKMNWNPRLDANEVQREWLHRAYGTAAGEKMELFYTRLNDLFREYYQKNKTVSYHLTQDMLKNLYAAHYGELESLFLAARNQQMSEPQTQRLALIEKNLIVLQWRLRQAVFLNAELQSPLQRSDEEVIGLLTADNPDFPLFPGIVRSQKLSDVVAQPVAYPWKVGVGESTAPDGKAVALSDDTILIYAQKTGEVQIRADKIDHGKYFASYLVRDGAGREITAGIFRTGIPVIFPVKAGEAYYLWLPQRKTVSLSLQVLDAKTTSAAFQNGLVTLEAKDSALLVYHAAKAAPLSVYDTESGVTIQQPVSGAAVVAALSKSKQYRSVRLLQSLDNGWRFGPDPQNDGVARGVTGADFADGSWKKISALDWWQFQGFKDYHGVAWYRIKFNGPALRKGERVRLYFGAVDGQAEVYLNGQRIIDRKLGEQFKGWDQPFSSDIFEKILPGENIIAVKVTSKSQTTASGIFKGVSLLGVVYP